MNKQTYLVFSIQGWTEMWVSKHWISAKLAEDSDVYFVEPFRGWLLPGRGGKLSSFFTGPKIRRERDVNVVSFTSLPGYYRMPGILRALARLVMWPQFYRFGRLLKENEYDIISFDYRCQPLLSMLPKTRRSLYYAIDLIRTSDQDPWWPEGELIRSSDAVVAISERHRIRVEENSGRKGIPVIPHGIDFSSALAAECNPEICKIKGKGFSAILGYTGSIHDLYVDFDVVAQVARQRSDWCFVFIGPTKRSELGVGSSQKLQALESLPNVLFLGSRPYSVIASYIKAFDVCLMPYHPSVDNEPFKTLQYFAQGKPVVAADVPGISHYRELLYIYQGREPANMESAIILALNEQDGTKAEERTSFAKSHDFAIIKNKLLEQLA